jgi:DHA1 family bicyclomycin/chloramphenicol resistance-like MFS transporter
LRTGRTPIFILKKRTGILWNNSFVALSNMNTNGSSKNFHLILILGLLTAIGPLSIDMYLPAFPDIAKSLHSSVAQVMLSLSSFFIGISVGQLLYGPLLERYGRKKPLYVGLCIYLFASAGCAMAASVNSLIAFRLLQAMGGCAGLVASRAIVRDLFDTKENAKIFSALMLVVAVSPIIAPTLGGYITAVFGWRVIFSILIAIDIAIFAGVYFLLPESKAPDPNFSLRAGAIIKNYVTIIKDPQFYTYALTGAVAYAGLCAYISGSPAVFMEIFRVNEKQYGWIFALIAVGIISASQLNNIALRNNSSERIIKVALGCQSMIGVLFALLTVFGYIELYSSIFLIFLFLGCQGFIFPNASALSLAAFAHNAGSASALMGAIQMSVGAGASALVSYLQNHTAMPMSGIMACCSVTAFTLYSLGSKFIIQPASKTIIAEEDVEMMSTL